MPENMVSMILPALFIVVWALVIVRIIIKTIKNKYASVKTVRMPLSCPPGAIPDQFAPKPFL